MKRIMIATLSTVALFTMFSSHTLALNNRFEKERQETMNKLNDRFEKEHQEVMNKLSNRFEKKHQEAMNK